jgi:hypothetical protein
MIIEMSDQELDEARDLFLNKGWQSFCAQIQQQIEDCSLDMCKDADDLWFQKGRLATLRSIAMYQDMCFQAEQISATGESSSLLQ